MELAVCCAFLIRVFLFFLPDGYHSPFTSRESLEAWWTIQSQHFQAETGVRSDDPSGWCPDEPLSPQAREAMSRLLETLKYLYAHNIIKQEFPDLDGHRMSDIRAKVVQILTRLGRRGIPTLLHELTIEVRFPEAKDRLAHARAYATRHVMHYATETRERIAALEEELEAARTEGEAQAIRERIRHIQAGLQPESLEGIRSQLVAQLMASELRPGPDYRQDIEATIVGIGVEGLCCLFERIESSDLEVRQALGRIVETIVERYLEKGPRGEQLLKAELGRIVTLLRSRHVDLVALGVGILRKMTGMDFGENDTLWREWLAEHYAPELASKLLEKGEKGPR